MEDPTTKPLSELKDKYTIEESKDTGDEDKITDKEKQTKDEEKEDVGDEKKDTEKPLLDEDSVKIDIKSDGEGEDTATLPISDKKKSKDDADAKKEKPPAYLFPFSQMKLAWTRSSNILEFLLRAVCIIFSTLGWLFCVGGVPFISVVMLIIGSVYVDDCNAQPKIPVYLMVAGVFGTIQHLMSVWTKYLPKESQGPLKAYRRYCTAVDSILHIFLAIWFIFGCVWVYGIYDDVNFKSPEKEEYCHKTLYYFAFWILNLSFIILMLIIVFSLCCILCIASSPKDEEKGIVQ